jgi:sugar lactone lactonase YvrE
MGERELQTLLDGGSFFEGPRWRDGRWWVSDFYNERVLAVSTDGSAEEVMHVEQRPSGLGWMPDGSLLVVSMKDHRILRQDPDDGAVSEHADLSAHCGGNLNDMVVDSQGRAFAGDFGFDLMAGADPAPTSLKRVDPDGTVTVVAEDLYFPNGMVITPDGMSLMVGESAASRYTAFAILDDGSLDQRRVWAQVAPEPSLASMAEWQASVRFAPDGCCLDVEGHIWSADAVGARCVRIAPGGDVVEEIRMPDGLGCFACMLGGEDGRTLLLCAAPDFGETSRAGQAGGVLFTTQVDAPHAGLP